MSSGVDTKQLPCTATAATMTTSSADADELKLRNRKNSTQTAAGHQLIGDYAGSSSDVEMEPNNGHIVNGNADGVHVVSYCRKVISVFL